MSYQQLIDEVFGSRRKKKSRFAKAISSACDVMKSMQHDLDRRYDPGRSQSITAADFFGKALQAQREGRCTGFDISRAEAALNAGQAVPRDVVVKIMG